MELNVDSLKSMTMLIRWCGEDTIGMVRDTLRWLRVNSWLDTMMRKE